jgi:hypothetical protein
VPPIALDSELPTLRLSEFRPLAAASSSRGAASDPAVLRHALTEIASYALGHRARLRQLTEVMKSSAGIRLSPLARLSEQELRLARQLAARRGDGPSRPSMPDWRTRLLVARAVAGLRVWLDDITGGDCADPWRHLEQIFGTEPPAGRTGPGV